MSGTRSYLVEFTDPADRDIEAITDYLIAHDAPDVAERFLVRVLDKVRSLTSFPERGSIPAELAELGVDDHRQLLLSPYRLIYHIGIAKVSVVLIADGRRDMRELLRRRLLSA